MSELQASSGSEPEPSTALAELSQVEEQFVLAYFANGGRGTEAYLAVRPDVTRESARASAARMLARDSVRAALERQRAALRARVELDTEILAQRLKAQAMGNLSDVADWGGSFPGVQLKASHELTPEQAALIEEIEVTPTEHGTKRKVKLVNRTAAARLLLELRGELKQTVKHEGEVVHKVVALPANLSREEWVERYAPGRQVKATVESSEVNER